MSYQADAISYSSDAPIDQRRNALRFLLQDNGPKEIFLDNELDAYLSQCGTVWTAAIELASLLIDRKSESKAGKNWVRYQNIINRIPEWRRRAEAASNAELLGNAVTHGDVSDTV